MRVYTPLNHARYSCARYLRMVHFERSSAELPCSYILVMNKTEGAAVDGGEVRGQEIVGHSRLSRVETDPSAVLVESGMGKA